MAERTLAIETVILPLSTMMWTTGVSGENAAFSELAGPVMASGLTNLWELIFSMVLIFLSPRLQRGAV
jgi:hypothetical protein